MEAAALQAPTHRMVVVVSRLFPEVNQRLLNEIWLLVRVPHNTGDSSHDAIPDLRVLDAKKRSVFILPTAFRPQTRQNGREGPHIFPPWSRNVSGLNLRSL
jgi:hypothetical protein